MLSRPTTVAACWLVSACAAFSLSCSSTPTPTLPVVAPESVGLTSKALALLSADIEELVRERRIAGGVFLLARDDDVAWLEAAGWQDVDDRVPMSTDTLFRICSMTKPITSVGIMILVEEGRLSLSDPLENYLPWFTDMTVAVARGEGDSTTYEVVPAQGDIIIEDLLRHTAGFTYGFWGREHFSDLYAQAGVSDGLIETEGTMGDNVRRLSELPLLFHPGRDWEYGLSTDVLGHVIEVVSGQTLDAFLRKRIFEPLEMNDTHFIVPPDERARVATVYRPGEDETIEELPDGVVRTGSAVYSASYPFQDETAFFSGGAGLVSTVPDYYRFLRMLLGGGELDGVRILEETTVRNMTRDHTGRLEVKIASHGDEFGLGFGVVTPAAADQGLGSPGTYSWGGFYHTYFWVDPSEKLIGIGMTQLYPWDHLDLWSTFRKRAYEALRD